MISCLGQIDGSHFLLGDEGKGRLLMPFVDSSPGGEQEVESGMPVVSGLKLEVLGGCSAPHTQTTVWCLWGPPMETHNSLRYMYMYIVHVLW